MIGRINDELEAIVALDLLCADGRVERVDAVVDTGFNGHLTLSPAQIRRAGAKPAGPTTTFLADGSEAIAQRFVARVSWLGKEQSVVVLEESGGSLLGMSLLKGCELHMRVEVGAPFEIVPPQ